MASLASLTVSIGADLSDLNRGLTEANKGVQKFGQQVTGNLTAPIRNSTVAMTANSRAVTQAAGSWGKLREPLTSATRSLLQLNPAVSQVSSVLGTMAIGAGPMVAVLAGIAALSLGWSALTKDARENKKATEDAIKALTDLRDKQRLGSSAGTSAREAEQAGTQLFFVQEEIAKLQKRLATQRAIGGGQETEKQLNEQLREQARLRDLIRGHEIELASVRAGKAKEREQQAAKELDDLEKLKRAQREYQDLLADRNTISLPGLRAPMVDGTSRATASANIAAMQIPQSVFDSLAKLGNRSAEQLRIAGLELQAAADAQKAAALQTYALSQVTSLLSQHGGMLGGIAAGAISGGMATGGNPWGIAIGAASALIGGLFGGHRKSVDMNTAAIEKLTASMNNEPAGFRVEPFRFQAAAPVIINGPITVMADDPWRLVRQFAGMQDDYSARGGVVTISG